MSVSSFVKKLGPGLLYAGAAVGVSHLVQSTRAGSSFGFELLGIIIIANLVKYPFFQFGPRYAHATGKSLIDGYLKLGKWAIVLYAILTLATMFTILAAVSAVTAGVFIHVFNLELSAAEVSAIILILVMLILLIGRYSLLDKLIKYVIVILTVSTLLAVVFAFNKGYNPNPDFVTHFDWLFRPHVLFLIAFVGWMPAPIDVSVWHSLWTIEKNKEIKSNSLKSSILDFNIGYFGTILLAMGFLTLGALVMYGSGEELSSKGGVFAGQLMSMYTNSLGQWAYPIIAIAAITTMFSTVLTCLDAFPRILTPTTKILFNKMDWKDQRLNWIWILILAVGALIMIAYFASSMTFMVDVATTLSVLTAPFFAVMNYKVVTDKHMPETSKPKSWMKVYSWIGIVLLSGFAVYFLIWKFWL
jgi:Mn2+/Fe2+ NRAMP family transporter